MRAPRRRDHAADRHPRGSIQRRRARARSAGAWPRTRAAGRRRRGSGGVRGSLLTAPGGRPAVVMVPSEASEHQVRGSQATLYLVAGHIVGNGGEKLVEGDRVDFPEGKGRQVREVTLVRKQALQPWPRSGRPVQQADRRPERDGKGPSETPDER